MTKKLVLDTCCFFCLIQGELGMDLVSELLVSGYNRELELYMSQVNYCEILYQIKREKDYKEVREYFDSLPITMIETNQEIVEYASDIKSKAKAKISLGDSFAIATAIYLKCPVATTNRHEFTKWENEVEIFWLR